MSQPALDFLYTNGHLPASKQVQAFRKVHVDAQLSGKFQESRAAQRFAVYQDSVTVENYKFWGIQG